MAHPKPAPLDDLERRIINLLQEDGRMSFVRMAELLGVTDATIRRKYSGLVEAGVIKIKALCDPYKVGFDAPVIIGINIEQKKAENVLDSISQIPEIQFAAMATGPYEILVQAVLRSNSDLRDFLLRLSQREGVIGTHTFLLLDIVKQGWKLDA